MENIEDIYPLSPMQRGMLFHYLSAAEPGVYFEQRICELHGRLDVEAFERAWQRVVSRHTILRTGFLWEGLDEPVQVVRRHVGIGLEREDWTALPPGEQEARLEALIEADRRRGFDLKKAPLMRLTLIRTGPDTHQFILSNHHLSHDGWCLPLLLDEVFLIYEAARRGEHVELAESRPYRDYIAWLQRQDIARAESFWRQTLKGFTAPTPLAVDRAPDGLHAGSADYGEEATTITGETHARLQTLARARRLTAGAVLQGAWAVLLSRYSGERDVVFGVTVAGRPAELAGVERMVGLFINTLPVRARVDGDASAAEWSAELQRRQLEMREYEYSPLSEVQGWGETGRGVPLFETIFVFQNFPWADFNATAGRDGALEIRRIRVLERNNFPLTVVGMPGRDELTLRLDYDRRRFDAATVRRMLGHYRTLVEAIAADPDRRLSELPMLTADERRELLGEWSRTATATEARARPVLELFEERASTAPESVAVNFGGGRLTYGELSGRAGRLARHLRRMGVGPDVRVGLFFERSAEMIVAVLGTLKAGGAYVPLDPEYPAERLAHMLRDSRVPVLLTNAALEAKLPAHDARVVRLDADWDAIAAAREELDAPGPRPDDLAYVIYTSGSTGRPKGVMVTHRNLAASTAARFLYYPRPVVNYLLLSSFCFDSSVAGIFWTLAVGGTLTLPKENPQQDLAGVIRLIHETGVTHLLAIPSLYALLLAQATREQLSTLQTAVVAGEACPPDLVERHRRTLAGASLFNEYGPTEASVWATAYDCSSHEAGAAVPIGRPIPGARVYLLDSTLEPVPAGIAGEVYIAGEGLARGYLNHPELTAERFIPDPFGDAPGARLYRTGDLAKYLDDGQILFLGRADDQVKVRGYRIELSEIEAVIRESGAVSDAVVAARDVGSEKRLVGYVVPPAGRELSLSALRGYLKERLPEYMTPSAFVVLEALPLTANGKVDRKRLPEPGTSLKAEAAYAPPRNEIEALLADTWQKVLGVPLAGIHDDFFALGGDSIRVLQLVHEIKKYNLPVKARDVLRARTVSKLASAIAKGGAVKDAGDVPLSLIASADGSDATLPADVEDAYPATRMQELMLSRYAADQGRRGVYHVQQWFNVADEEFSGAAFRTALEVVVQRHPALRTVFARREGGPPLQLVRRRLDFHVTEDDLSGMSGREQEEFISRVVAEDRAAAFDAFDGDAPLFRFRVMRRSREAFEFFMSIHHALNDGWGNVEFLKELLEFYRAVRRGEEPQPPPAANSLKEFVALEREVLASREAAEFWRAHLQGERHRPLARRASGVGAEDEGGPSLALDAGLAARLGELARALKVSLKTVFLSAYLDSVARLTGESVVTVGVVSNGRSERLADPLRALGLFWNIVPFCARTEREDKVAQLKRVQRLLIDVEAHARYPLAQMLEDRRRPELFFATLNFLHFHNAGRLSDGRGLAVTLSGARDKFHFPLNCVVAVNPFNGEIRLTAEYDGDYFDAAAVESLLGEYIGLLEGLTEAAVEA